MYMCVYIDMYIYNVSTVCFRLLPGVRGGPPRERRLLHQAQLRRLPRARVVRHGHAPWWLARAPAAAERGGELHPNVGRVQARLRPGLPRTLAGKRQHLPHLQPAVLPAARRPVGLRREPRVRPVQDVQGGGRARQVPAAGEQLRGQRQGRALPPQPHDVQHRRP